MLEAKGIVQVFLHRRIESNQLVLYVQVVEEVFHDMVQIQEGMEVSYRAVAVVSSVESRLQLPYQTTMTRFAVISKPSGLDARIKTEEDQSQPLRDKDMRAVCKG
jgi:hypothetical protein